MTNKEKSLMDVIAYAEGTLGVSNNGYDVVVGYRKIIGWTETTKIVHGHSSWYHKELNSTAAGRYQFTYDTWIGTKGGVNKPFTKSNQDTRCLELIKMGTKEINLENLTNRSVFDSVLKALGGRWASLPNGSNKAPYTSDELFSVFNEALSLYNG